jgi:glycerol-3-phosphate dehydrogenase (NAD(P)+)
LVLIAVPSGAMRSVAKDLKSVINPNTIVVSVAKGFDTGSLKTMSVVLSEELDNPVVVLSGPSHAEEIARGIPTTVVATSKSQKDAKYVQHTLSNSYLRIYTNNDIVGVELGGALKNVIALAAGILDGLKFGDNAKAALMTRGLSEIATLGAYYGANPHTFAGLTGIGDLSVTCTSLHSRNYRTGLLIGQGKTPDQAIAEVGMTVEGYTATKNAYELMKESGVDMPIIEQIYLVLYKNKNPREAVTACMSRPYKDEREHIWLD